MYVDTLGRCLVGLGVAICTISTFADERAKPRQVVSLFSGADLANWEIRAFSNYDHKGEWEVCDGAIVCNAGWSDLAYRKFAVPNEFELDFEWMSKRPAGDPISGDCGELNLQFDRHCKQYIDRDKKPRKDWMAQFAVQFPIPGGCLKFATDYVPIEVDERDNTNSYNSWKSGPRRNVEKAFGEWNHGKIVWRKGLIQHWVNGNKVIDEDFGKLRVGWHPPKQVRQLMTERLYVTLDQDVASKPGDVRFRNIQMKVVVQHRQSSQ